MAEKQIPAIAQVGEKVGINIEAPLGTLHISGSGVHGGGSFGAATPLLYLRGDTDYLVIENFDGGDYAITNRQQNNAIVLRDGTGGVQFFYNGANKARIDTTGLAVGNIAAQEKLTVVGNINQTADSNEIYNNFTSGYVGGAGWQIKRDDSNGSRLEIDNITVRNTLQTHIFQKDVVKAANGFLYISDSGVIVSKSDSESKVTFGSASATFSDNDLLHYKDTNPNTGDINSVYFRINGSPSETASDIMGNSTYTYVVDELTGSFSDLVIGGTAVRVSGGSLLLDASSPNSPFMDVINNDTTFVRTGNLAGITSTKFGSLSGFGFWASGSAYLEGDVNADGGEIGGWNIDTNSISKNNIKLDSTTGYLKIGTVTSVTDTSNAGLFAENDGDLLISQDSNNYLKFNSGVLDLKAQVFNLSTPQLQINSATKTIAVGSSIGLIGDANSNTGELTIGNSITLKGSGTSTITGDMEIAGWTISSSIIQKTGSSSTDGIVIDSSNKVIQVQGASGTGVTANSRANTRLLVGQVSTADYGIKAWDDSGERIFELSDNRTEIAGWSFTNTQIKTGSLVNGGIVIQSSPSNNINIRTGSSSDTLRVSLGQESIASNTYGLFGYDSGGVNKIFELSNTAQQIAGFEFTQNEIAKNNITMSNAAGGKITLNNGTTFLSGSGEGQFANGGIQFDKDGNVIITGSVTIGADVTVNAEVAVGALPVMPSGENLRGHWTFDSPTAPYWDFSDSSNTGSHSGTDWVFEFQQGVVTSCIRTQDNGGVQILPDSKVNSELQQSYCGWFKPSGVTTTTSDRLLSRDWSEYFAWLQSGSAANPSYDGDGLSNLLVGRSSNYVTFTDGLTSGSWHFIAMTLNYSTNTGKAYLYKADGTLETGSFTCGTNPAGEGNVNVLLACNSEPDTTIADRADDGNWSGSIDELRFFTEVLSDNEIDALYLNASGPRQTLISGDNIQTGKIQSNNWPSFGSELDLNAGTIKLGGETTPKFTVDNSGNISASGEIHISGSGKIAGWDIEHKYIGNQQGNRHLYIAKGAFGFDSANYSDNPVISIYDSSANFKVDVGTTLYNHPNNAGILIYSDYQNLYKLFEASVDGAGNTTASIAGWDFNRNQLAKSNVTMSSTNEQIKLGTTSTFGSGTGVLLGKHNSDYEFYAGNGTEYIWWDGTNLHIKSTDIEVEVEDLHITASDILMETDTFFLGSSGSSGQFLSGSGGKIEISSSNFHLLDGNVTASNVDLTGNITATSGIFSGSISASEGTIGKFDISDRLKSSDDRLILNPTSREISVGSAEAVVKINAVDGFYAGAASRDDNTPFQAKLDGQVTGSSVLFTKGKVGNWFITSSTLQSDDFVFNDGTTRQRNYYGLMIDPTLGIRAKPRVSHSLESNGGHFSFAIAHISVGPGQGGQQVNPTTGQTNSVGDSGNNYDEPQDDSSN